MILTFRPIKVWPDGWRDSGRRRLASPFQSHYRTTLANLDDELRKLNTMAVTLQVDVADGEVRLDGQLRADARPSHPGVILTIETKSHGTLVYATDRFESWHANLRAITLGLEALRKIERYGIAERGQQYAGYRELGSGIPIGPARMTVEQAAAFLVEHGEWGDEPADPDDLIGDGPLEREVVAQYYRHAAKKLHPDHGGDPAMFLKLKQAKDVLDHAARGAAS